MVYYKNITVDKINVFYREAGDTKRPTLVLFNGFPSASHMFRDLIPLLEDEFHLIAPDFPGFGMSPGPNRNDFTYTFDNIATVMDHFLDTLHITSFFMYVFDYGTPIGFRIAMQKPDAIRGIITQNGNIYEAGLGFKWAARKEYWAHPTVELREHYKSAFAIATIRGQYETGTNRAVAPDGWMLDFAYTTNLDYAEKQADLIFDYQTNVAMYPQFQAYVRQHQPLILVVWGKNDPSFIAPGAKAFEIDSKNVQIHLLDTGHFALETHAVEIASLIKKWI